jgi:threonine dehydrogenase-like Zn-dependent dehydrogenase
MKALVYTDTLEVQYRDEPEPVPGPGEALVAIEAVGICGSDMHAYHGHDERRIPPLILGHEAVGVVQNGALKGRRVVLNPLMTCGVCNHCQGGRSNLCAKRELIGMRLAGAFAQYITIPERNLLDMPQDMDPVIASLAEPAATSLHAIYLADKVLHRPLSECRALVLGGGSIGAFAALMLKDKGCHDICLGDTNPLRRHTAERLAFWVTTRIARLISVQPYVRCIKARLAHLTGSRPACFPKVQRRSVIFTKVRPLRRKLFCGHRPSANQLEKRR